MKNLLIGSRALAHNIPEFAVHVKDHTDWDVITYDKLDWAEVHDPDHLNTYKLERYALSTPIVHNGVELYPLSLKGLAILKRSHLWRDLGFKKHITMYHKHIMNGSFEFDEDDLLLLGERTKLTMDAYPQLNPSLKKTKDQFFDDFVVKKFDHDYLHEVLAVNPKSPMYKRMQDLSVDSVWCIKELWDKFTHQEKIDCVYEEATVIAFERFIVPSDYKFNFKIAYMLSLDKVCTTLTSGWFRDFAIDNYDELANKFDQITYFANYLYLKGDYDHVYS